MRYGKFWLLFLLVWLRVADSVIAQDSYQSSYESNRTNVIEGNYLPEYSVSENKTKDQEKIIKEENPATESETLSATEKMFSDRIVNAPKQFGYDLFDKYSNDEQKQFSLKGNIQEDFIIGIGDKINITFRGQRNDSKIYTVNSQGEIIIDGLPPIAVAGKNMLQLTYLMEQHAQRLKGTEVYVSLHEIGAIDVLVVGHVNDPGLKKLTSVNTVFDALAYANGIDKNGTLRKIKLIRNGRTTIIDMYALLIHGIGASDIFLRDGDRIIVPPAPCVRIVVAFIVKQERGNYGQAF